MKGQKLRLRVLCEDELHQNFVERLATRYGIGDRQRRIDAAPAARGTAAGYVLDNFVGFVDRWRSESHDANVVALVMIDGDEKGFQHRKNELAAKLKDAHRPALDRDPRFAILIPCWHIETWIAWLCGHRPIDEQTRYKRDNQPGSEVGRKIKAREYSARLAVESWTAPQRDETSHVPSLAYAREELKRLGVSTRGLRHAGA